MHGWSLTGALLEHASCLTLGIIAGSHFNWPFHVSSCNLLDVKPNISNPPELQMKTLDRGNLGDWFPNKGNLEQHACFQLLWL